MRHFHHERHFSVAEARALLERLRPHIERMVALVRQLDESGFDVHLRQYRWGWNPDTLGPYPPAFYEVMEIVRMIHAAGVLVKRLDEGLVDFPHIRDDGEEVYLCWKLGEPTLAYWHPRDTGFAGRRPLAETGD